MVEDGFAQKLEDMAAAGLFASRGSLGFRFAFDRAAAVAVAVAAP